MATARTTRAKPPRGHDDGRPLLRVRSFGPLRECELPVRDMLVLIGEQASGKSTLAKLLYFFQSVPALVEEHAARLSDGPAFKNWVKLARQRFMESFGTTKHLPSFDIEYRYSSDVRLRLTQEQKTGHVRVDPDTYLSKAIVDRIEATGRRAEREVRTPVRDPLQQPLTGALDADEEAAQRELRFLTRCEAVRVFVPSARSLLSVLTTDLLYNDLPTLDPLMQQFVRRIAQLQQGFARPLEDQLEDALHSTLRAATVDERRVKKAMSIVRAILKGTYVYDRGKEAIEIEGGQQVHLRFASSGQQEALWIVLLLFSIILHNTPATVIMEEPEAHLFPYAQRDMVELIALGKNIEPLPSSPRNGAVLTTHSPYVLAALNNLLYASQVGKRDPEAEKKVSAVVDKNLWLDPDDLGVWFVEDGKIRSILDPDLHLIQAEEIDGVSSKLRSTFDALAEIEET